VGWSTDVTLGKDRTPTFPDRCVVCGRASPDGTRRVRTSAVGWWSVLGFHGSGFGVEVPACGPCGRGQARQQWLRFGLGIAAMLAIAGAAVYFLGVNRGPFRKPILLGITLLGMIPFFAWEAWFPPAFDLTAFNKTVDYEFRDPDYAAEFAGLNPPLADDGPTPPSAAGSGR
jgi:hypothetical protein